MYSVLAGTTNHPDSINPYQGLFNYRSLRALAQSGPSVDAVAPRPFAPPVGPYSSYSSISSVEDWGSYSVHHPRIWYLIPKRAFYSVAGVSYANRIPEYVSKTFDRPDVIHACHLYPDGYGLLPYARANDVPLFVVCHGSRLNSMGDHPPGVEPRVRETLDAATGVLCVSDALAEKASRYTDASKVETVPIGADPANFPVDQRERLREELDIDLDATVVLFVGQFYERKGIGEITDLLPDLNLDDTVFVFVGQGGSMEEELRVALTESDFSARHIYTGITTLALRRWFALADLYFLPSHSEGRPTAIYEAMASKTAVLGTEVGGVPEQVVDGETGRLIPPKDVGAIESALQELTADRQVLWEMGKAGCRRLREKNWTWADHAERIKEVHRAAIE
ncbi:glycosyltransferase [Haloarcula argentinensis]|uniref:Glycosyltransferase n=1 Tax=Haloarcula argentinensis TaxID=43776 RepID=A0A847UHM3_HALAR|nr:glycosyltransferase [Haloarcula argentinensis]NLV15283.1 glycosyltransferase [Haloarcula argentinensis]